MTKLLFKTKIKLLTLLGAVALFSACANGPEDFSNWLTENQGKPLSPELMEDLISEFGTPIDTLRGEDLEIEAYSRYLFLGPHFTIEEGKALFEQARMENEKLFAAYTARCAESSNDLNSNCPEWEEFKYAWEELITKYSNLYDSLTQNKKTTLGTFLTAYKARFPGLPENQYLDSLRAFQFRGITDYEINQINETRYSFISQASVSYNSVYGDGSTDEDLRDFKVDVYNDLVILGDGTIAGESIIGSSYCITDDSKKEVENHLIGTWNYESGGVSGSYTFNEDGTYSYSSSLFDIYKEGEWWINCSGGLQDSYGVSKQITNSGILVGETLYTK